MRVTILMSFHERAGESSMIQTAWMKQGTPLFTPEVGRRLMRIIFDLGMPLIADDKIQKLFADNYNEAPPSKNQPYSILQVDDGLSRISKKLPIPNRALPSGVHSLKDAKDSATTWMNK